MDNFTKFQLTQRIKELEEDLVAEKMVKKSEAERNHNLICDNEKKDLHINTLVKINEHYSDIIAKLRKKLKEQINGI